MPLLHIVPTLSGFWPEPEVLIMFPGWRYLILPSALRPLPPRRPVHAKTGQSCEDLPPETVTSFVKG